jgi:hypothetical protein
MNTARPIGTCVVALALAVLIAAPLGAAPRRDRPPKVAPVAGTTWSGTTSDGSAYVFNFEPDGTLSYTSPTGSYRNGTWTQSGAVVSFEMNNHYADYRGEIRGETMTGQARNVTGLEWTWKVTREK